MCNAQQPGWNLSFLAEVGCAKVRCQKHQLAKILKVDQETMML